jgi:NRAMP (natural resistance-associated macrophage protein)-like metal ion transporter
MFKGRKNIIKKLLIFFSVLGPGIITLSAGNDAGGITTYSICGAKFGFTMLWIAFPLTVGLVVIQELSNRMGVVTGKGLSGIIREKFGVRITFYLMLGVFLGNLCNVTSEFAGIAASIELFGIPKYISVPFFAILVWVLAIYGNYKTVEKVFLVGCLCFLSYIIAGFMAKPDWKQIGHNLVVPHLQFESGYLVTLIAVLGTTIAPWMQFYHQSSAAEKGTKPEHLNYSRLDASLGSVLANMVAFFIVITCAATLFHSNIQINEAKDAALALKPLAGVYSFYLFAFGLLNASLLAACVLPLSAAFTVCEGFGWETGVAKTASEAPQFYTIYSLLIIFGSVVVLIPNISLIRLMIFSQIINGLLLPIVVFFTIILANDRKIMGQYTNTKFYNILAWLVGIGASALSVTWLIILLKESFVK